AAVMGIRNKLFLTFLATFLVLILAAGGFFFFAFERSLSKYIDERQQAQVERLADHLGALHAQRGGWRFLLEAPRLLARLYWLAGDREARRDRDTPRHLTLLSADKRPLLGPPPSRFSGQAPIRVGDTLVGWLAYPDQQAIRDKLDRRFQERLLRF